MSLVDVYQMAEAREYRKKIQEELIEKNKLPLISFTLNIPGPKKNSTLYRDIHLEGITAIKTAFPTGIVDQKLRDVPTGCEAYFSLKYPATEIKKKVINIEDNHKLGRIFDIDVFDVNQYLISRRDLNCSSRKCLICSEEAALCSRSRKHSVEELIYEIHSIYRIFRTINK